MNSELMLDLFRESAESYGLKETLSSIKENMRTLSKEFLQTKFKEIFANHPKLQMVSWTGYTAFWNDGETCEFSSNHNYADFNNEEEMVDCDDDLPDLTKKENNFIKKDFDLFMNQFNDDDMLSMFGDHVLVVVRPSGISVQEYDNHD